MCRPARPALKESSGTRQRDASSFFAAIVFDDMPRFKVRPQTSPECRMAGAQPHARDILAANGLGTGSGWLQNSSLPRVRCGVAGHWSLLLDDVDAHARRKKSLAQPCSTSLPRLEQTTAVVLTRLDASATPLWSSWSGYSALNRATRARVPVAEWRHRRAQGPESRNRGFEPHARRGAPPLLRASSIFASPLASIAQLARVRGC